MENNLVMNSIKSSQIENLQSFSSIINKSICCVCLDIPLIPLECYKCSTIICEDCYEIMKIAGKKCVSPKCEGDIKKANKFLRESLSMILLTCNFCNQTHIEYKSYIKHLHSECESYKLAINKREAFLADIREKNELIRDIESEVNNVKLQTTMGILSKSNGYNHTSTPMLSADELRKKLITATLPTEQKMELYKATVNGDINTFKNLITNKGYPLFEEISAKGFYWTPLHYAMHYGQIQIICFIMDQMATSLILDQGMALESTDGRSPVLCLLRSNALDNDKKKAICEKLVQRYGKYFTFSKEDKKEMESRGFYKDIKQYK